MNACWTNALLIISKKAFVGIYYWLKKAGIDR